MIYAIVQNGVVKNVIVWDGPPDGWTPPAGCTAVLSTSTVGIGYTYDGTKFTPPA